MKKLVYKATVGKNVGKIHEPHLFNDGFYVVSRTRFAKDYVNVKTLNEVYECYKKGFNIRMSHKGEKPSLISPKSVQEI